METFQIGRFDLLCKRLNGKPLSRGQCGPLHLFPVLWMRQELLHAGGKVIFLRVLPAVDALLRHAVQTGVPPAEEGQPGPQCLQIGEPLGLAGRGADEQISQLIVAAHLIRRHHAGKYNVSVQMQLLRQLLQRPPVRAIPHQQERDWSFEKPGYCPEQFGAVFLPRQPPQVEKNGPVIRDAQALPQDTCLGRTCRLRLCDSGGDHIERALHTVPPAGGRRFSPLGR